MSIKLELQEVARAGLPLRRRLGSGGQPVAFSTIPARYLREVLTKASLKARIVAVEGMVVTGQLDLCGDELCAPFVARRCRFTRPVRLEGAVAPAIRLLDCEMPRLDADQLKTVGDLELSGCTVGVVDVAAARIGGRLLLERTTLRGASAGDLSEPLALMGDELHVEHQMRCARSFAGGGVMLRNAYIGGELSFSGAHLRHGFDLDRSRVGHNLQCQMVAKRSSFRADKPVRLLGVQIGGQALFLGAVLQGGLRGDGLQVGNSMSFRDAVITSGAVYLAGANVAHTLSFRDATISTDAAGCGIDLRSSEVAELSLRFKQPPAGELNLRNARLGRLRDAELTWPQSIRLAGCEYRSLEAQEDAAPAHRAPTQGRAVRALCTAWRRHRAPADVERRLRWLARSDEAPRPRRPLPLPGQRLRGARPRLAGALDRQPYAQLIAVYRAHGRDSDARRIAYCYERRHSQGLPSGARLWSLLLRLTVGFGYRPLRAVGLLLGLVAVGTVVFSHFHAHGHIPAVRDGQPFRAEIYAVDRLVPVVSFGQREVFAPRGLAQTIAFGYALCGWLLTIATVAGVTAAVRRE